MEGANFRLFPQSSAVGTQNQPCEGLYVLAKGSARELLRAPTLGTEVTLRVLKPGDAYGLVALVDGKDNATSLVTLQPSEFLVLPKEMFQAVLQHHPEVFRDAMDHLCQQAREAYLWIGTLV